MQGGLPCCGEACGVFSPIIYTTKRMACDWHMCLRSHGRHGSTTVGMDSVIANCIYTAGIDRYPPRLPFWNCWRHPFPSAYVETLLLYWLTAFWCSTTRLQLIEVCFCNSCSQDTNCQQDVKEKCWYSCVKGLWKTLATVRPGALLTIRIGCSLHFSPVSHEAFLWALQNSDKILKRWQWCVRHCDLSRFHSHALRGLIMQCCVSAN